VVQICVGGCDARFVTREAAQILDEKIREIALQPSTAGTRIEITGGSKRDRWKNRRYGLPGGVSARSGGALSLSFEDVITGGTSDGNLISDLASRLDGMGPIGD